MALVSWTSIDSRLAELHQQFTSLESELTEIQTNYDDLRREHEHKCATALMEALSSLVKVIKYVNRTDKALIFWVEKGGALKVALRYIGIDRRTQTIVRKKTAIIKDKVSEVGSSFNKSNQAFKNGLSAVQDLNTRLTQYSLTSIGRAQREVTEFSEELDEKIKEVNWAITKLKAQSRDIEDEASEVPGRIEDVNSQRQKAQEASNAAGRVSIRQKV
jgi:methyl-accepting chemotaxis protein